MDLGLQNESPLLPAMPTWMGDTEGFGSPGDALKEGREGRLSAMSMGEALPRGRRRLSVDECVDEDVDEDEEAERAWQEEAKTFPSRPHTCC